MIRKMVALKQGDWLSERDYIIRREEILKRVASATDSVERIQTYMMLAKTGLVSEEECSRQRQKCIDDIFKPCASMDEFKNRVNTLLEFQKAGIITEEEFVAFKTKLMSDL